MSSVYANLISCSNLSGGIFLFKYALLALVWFKGWYGSSRPNLNSPVASWLLLGDLSSTSSSYQQTQALFNVWKQLDKS